MKVQLWVHEGSVLLETQLTIAVSICSIEDRMRIGQDLIQARFDALICIDGGVEVKRGRRLGRMRSKTV